jgi:riboflavin kinase/FMN adenylyltransferase
LFGSWAAFALAGDRLHEAIAHVGVRPSVGGGGPLLEVHLFDFDGDLYGKHLQVSLLRKVSEEVRLESLELLRGKIEEDVRRVRRYFDELREHVLPSMTVE